MCYENPVPAELFWPFDVVANLVGRQISALLCNGELLMKPIVHRVTTATPDWTRLMAVFS
jgi:hypothetical protein